MRQLQIKNGVAGSEVSGNGLPKAPDTSWTFLDVTDRPEAQVGMTYDAATDTFSKPAPVAPVIDPDDPREALKAVRAQLSAIRAKLGP